MPDSPPTPDAEAPQPEADELAKGLPGLPLQFGKVSVSEEGFVKRDKHGKPVVRIAWAEVTTLGGRGDSIAAVAGLASPRCVIRCRAKRKDKMRVTDAWREYLVRKMERDGVCAGGCAPDQVTREIVVGLSLTGLYAAMLASFVLRGFSLSTGGLTLVMLAGLAPLALVGFYAFIFVMDRLRRRSTLMERWRKWELRREGIVYWPDENERTLTPGPNDIVTVEAATVSGVGIPFIDLRYGFLARELMLAMAERNGAECRPSPGPRASWLLSGFVLIASLASLWYVIADTKGGEEAAYRLLFLTSLVLVYIAAMAIGVWYLNRVVFRDSLAAGRAMLERLGW